MILFHGTSDKFLKSILRHGLRPRMDTGKSTYDGELESHAERVYLTDTYALQFGANAVEKHGGRVMVVVCKVDESRIEPDTDFMEGGLHRLRFDNGIECLAQTGCCSVVGQVEVLRVEVLSKKQCSQISQSRIETGFRHAAFKPRTVEEMEYHLMLASRYTKRDGGWYNDRGEEVPLSRAKAY